MEVVASESPQHQSASRPILKKVMAGQKCAIVGLNGKI